MESKHYSTLAIIIAVVAIILALNVDRNKSTTYTNDTLSEVQKSGIIEACTIVNPPFSIKDPKTNERSGYMIEVLNLIAAKMDAKVNWHESTWGNATAELASKRCDIVAAEFFANVPRAKAIAFTRPPLFYIGTGAVIRKNDNRFQNVNNILDFDKSNIIVAVSTGEAGDIYVKEHFKNAQVRRIDVESSDITRFILEITTNRADVAIAGSDVLSVYIGVHSDVVDIFKDKPFGINPVGWAVRQDDSRWLDFIETSLQFLVTQGDMQQIEEKYGVRVLHEVKEYK